VDRRAGGRTQAQGAGWAGRASAIARHAPRAMRSPPMRPHQHGTASHARVRERELTHGARHLPLSPTVSHTRTFTHAGPLASLFSHLADPMAANIGTNIGSCVTPATAEIGGITIPLTCLWPGGGN
jgi:hypothetical protein